MAVFEFKLPAMGEGIIEATITSWKVSEGDEIAEDDIIVEVATDKVDSEVPAPVKGKVVKLLYNEGDTPAIGEVIAQLETADDHAKTKTTPTLPATEANTSVGQQQTYIKKADRAKKPKAASYSHIELPLFILQYAKSRGVSREELQQIKSGKGGTEINKSDIINYIKQGRAFRENGNAILDVPTIVDQAASQPAPNNTNGPVGITLESTYEVIEMDRMRKLVADHMVTSKRTSPHVTSFIEADVTDIVNWREKIKDSFLENQCQRLTYTTLFVEAVSEALQEHPDINVSVLGDKIIRKKEINIGIATALKNGNLIVPVIKNANNKNLVGLAHAVNDLTARARANKLNPSEIKGGTFTITNLGNFDNISGTPIINQPEVAILAVGAIKRKPAVVNTEFGETIGIRSIIMLSLSYDHRVVDGALGGMFLNTVAKKLETFDVGRTF